MKKIHLWLWQYTDEFGKRVESSWHRTEATVREFAHHALIFSQAATQELTGSPEILDVRDVATSPAVFYQTVSDHLPIRARFRSGPDDD